MIAIVELPENQLDWNLKALDLAEKSTDPRTRKWKGSLYNNIGWTLFESKEHNKALDMFQRALRWRQEQGQPREVRIAKWVRGKDPPSAKSPAWGFGGSENTPQRV